MRPIFSGKRMLLIAGTGLSLEFGDIPDATDGLEMTGAIIKDAGDGTYPAHFATGPDDAKFRMVALVILNQERQVIGINQCCLVNILQMYETFERLNGINPMKMMIQP